MKKLYKTPEIKIEELEKADVLLDSDTNDQDNGMQKQNDLITFTLSDFGLI
ncbi:MAG: hypothetical protein IJ903_07130 [Ruminococcus sp.]|nr:hypothetical protein [Ruminococcus sp.]